MNFTLHDVKLVRSGDSKAALNLALNDHSTIPCFWDDIVI